MSTADERKHDKEHGGGPIKGRKEDQKPIRRPTVDEANKALGEKEGR
jgi:hypothetical protein